MSNANGPRPVAWEGWHATITGEPPRGGRPGVVDVQEHEENGEPARDYTTTPDEAERHGIALIMAAAVARGEQGHTAALNRVAKGLGSPEPWSWLAHGPVTPEQQTHLDKKWGRGAVDDLRAELAEAERDAAMAALAEAREAQADAEAARAAAVQEASRLRVRLGELREALSGKTQHDAVAEVVAPLREAMGAGWGDSSECAVVAHVVSLLDEVRKVGSKARQALGLQCGEMEAIRRAVGACGGVAALAGAVLVEAPKPAREPMTHTSLASIERHGVVVGDSIEWAGGMGTGKMLGRVEAQGLVARIKSVDRYIVEAPDAD